MNLTQRYRTRSYAVGGPMLMQAITGGNGQSKPLDAFSAVQTASLFSDANSTGDVANALRTGARYGQAGQAIGSALGPLGETFGRNLGTTIGAVSGLVNARRDRMRVRGEEEALRAARQREQMGQYQAMASLDPSSVTGIQGQSYFANGGNLKSGFLQYKAKGGTLSTLNSNTVEVNGPTHENGGVQLPGKGAEVEGKETISDDFVFSNRLGFSKLHRPIAKAIGNLEKKPMSQQVLNSLKRLRQKEASLALAQETFKQQNGIV